MRRLHLTLILCVPLALLSTSVEAQQGRTANPHGSLTEVDCADCHSAAGWKPVKATLDFDHDGVSGFALSGRHREASCTSCHLGSRFDEPKAAPGDCTVCHVDVHRGRLSDNCISCHTTTVFTDVPGIAVHAKTSFPLIGAHVQVSCESCHGNDRSGAYTPLDTDCLGCHESAYRGATAIDHVAAGYSSDCRQCHSTLAWTHNSGLFDHGAVSGGYQLVGAHLRIRCESCHAGADLTPIYATSDANDCIGCHQRDYDQAHSGVFSTSCLDCHTNETWSGVTFDHRAATGGYELAGAHAVIACDACHDAGTGVLRFAAANQNDCIACHQPDYDGAHANDGFPPTCLSCHTDVTWNGATFADHDAQFFPIFSGAHRGKWSDCATCHAAPNNYQVFDCITCHDHNQQKMDDKHSGESRYAYNSAACFNCHPRGRKE
jgi:hypothetical protein